MESSSSSSASACDADTASSVATIPPPAALPSAGLSAGGSRAGAKSVASGYSAASHVAVASVATRGGVESAAASTALLAVLPAGGNGSSVASVVSSQDIPGSPTGTLAGSAATSTRRQPPAGSDAATPAATPAQASSSTPAPATATPHPLRATSAAAAAAAGPSDPEVAVEVVAPLPPAEASQQQQQQQQQPQPQLQPAPPGDAGADSTDVDGVVAASTTADDAAAAAAEVAAAAEGGEEAVQTTSEEPEDQARAHAEAHAEAQAQLVESENVTALKAMLNTEGVLGDVRVNAELCEFLRLDENIDAMLDLCLQGFTEEDVQRSEELFATVGGLEHLPERFRLAYVAAEILSSEPFCDPLHDLTEGHLDKLFSFLDFPYMNSWLSLRIFECIHRILTNRPSLFLHYIARRQARDGSFMRTLTTAVYWSPFADLLSALIIRESEDTPSQWWLENGVVEHVAELAEGKHIPPAADAYQ
eukprot:Rhum_TRINITY_DN15245_c11_g6::Rhum_TRINITY_DN15245_c11_g6_i1::g.146937::m.146937